MKDTRFNSTLFYEVLESNLKTFKVSTLIHAESFVFRTSNPIKTEDETRQMAVDFFKEQLAKTLHEYLK